jgi:PAS domain S-box-containing protein
MRDETDVVITREELLESEEHFRAFGLASNEAMMIHNTNGILDWNPRLGEMTGFAANEIAGMRAEDFIHPMERNRLANSDNSPNKAYTTLFRTKKGESVEVAITEREIDWKNEKARIKVIRDITHLKDVDQLLHLSRERYKTITDNTFDVVACFGSDLKLSFVNQTFLDYFGKPVAPNTSLLEAIDARDHQRVINHLTEIGPMNPVKRTLHRVRYNGETRWLDWIDRAVFDDNGNFVEFQGIGRDVTDYIRKAKELQK